MAYILHKEKPYYIIGKKIYPCSVSANSVKVDFDHPVKGKLSFNCVYTETEIRHRLGIKMIDGWDDEKKKVVKVSNQTISSIPVQEKQENQSDDNVANAAKEQEKQQSDTDKKDKETSVDSDKYAEQNQSEEESTQTTTKE